jgi:PAS domain S-box-containing protein
MNLKFITNKHYTNGIKVLLVFIMLILTVAVYQTKQVIQSGNKISKTQDVLLYAKKILSHALGSESSFRGFILTGRKNFIAPMEQAQKEIYADLGYLKKLTKSNPAQQLRVDSMIYYIEKRMTFSGIAVKMYKQNGADSAIKMVETGEGKIYTDHIRLLVDNIQEAENVLLAEHKKANDKSVKNLQRILLLTMAVIFLLLLFFIQKVRGDNIEKEKAAAALQKINDELEQRVVERTQQLDKKEKLFRALVENNEGIISLIDDKFNLLFRSASTALITGKLFGENEKITISEYLHPDDRVAVTGLMAQAIANPGKTIELTVRVRHKNGYYIWLEGVIKNMRHDPAIGGIITNLRDISERKRAEEKIIKANRLYFFISHINQMIVRTRDEATLFKEACQIAVSEGKFRMAWIGMIDEKTNRVIPLMHAGDDSGYPSFINQALVQDKYNEADLITNQLDREKYIVCNDIEKDSRLAHCKEEALGRGYRSFMSLPIKISGKTVGLFSFYADTKDFFDAAEMALLEEATSDISFALEVFEKEKLRSKAAAEIKIAVERYDILAQATSDTIWDWNIANNTMLYNEGITKMFGYKASEVENVVDWWNEKLHPDDFKKVTELVEDVFEKGLQKFQVNYRFRCADNTYKHIFDRAYVQFDDNGNPCRMIGAMQDITYQVDEEIRTSKAIIDAQEQERNFIGGELHDNVNQILAGSVLALSMVKEKNTDTRQSFEFIQMGKGHIMNAIEELRKLSHKLAPASFDDSSLKDAFEELLQTFNVNNQFNIKLNFDEKCNAVDGDIQINLYRILQEQIKNIVKYAAATEIEITIKRSGELVQLRVVDNGKGFNTKTAKKGIGLSNIKKRAESFSGKFILRSSPGKGCEIMVEIPLVP